MKTSFKLAMQNLRCYWMNALGRSFMIFALSFVVLTAAMFSASVQKSISQLLNSRSSGNSVFVRADKTEISSIEQFQFVNEVTPMNKIFYLSGNVSIEEVGTFQTNVAVVKGESCSALLPKAYLQEFEQISDTTLMLAGRLPQSDNEILLASDFVDSLQIYDYSVLLGKTIDVFEPVFNSYYIEKATVVGVFASELTKVTALDSLNKIGGYYCFLLLDANANSDMLEVFVNKENIDNVQEMLIEHYGEENVMPNTITNWGIDELEKIAHFMQNVLILIFVVVGIVYSVIQFVIISNYLNKKQKFVTAVRAFGLEKKRLFVVFVMEYLVLSVVSFVLSIGVSAVFANALCDFSALIAGVKFGFNFDLFSIFISFLVLLAINFVTILCSVHLKHEK